MSCGKLVEGPGFASLISLCYFFPIHIWHGVQICNPTFACYTEIDVLCFDLWHILGVLAQNLSSSPGTQGRRIVVQLLSHVWLFATQHGLQHARLPCPSLSFRVCSNSGPLSQWCHPIISYSVAPFSSCPQSFPASGSFPVSQLFASGGQSFRTSASASIFPVSIQGWFTFGLTSLISLLSKGLRSFLHIALCPNLISILLDQNLTRFLKRKFGQVSIWSCFTYYL